MSLVSRLLDARGPSRHDAGGGVVIEPMRRRHVREILPIEEQVYPRPWTPGVFQSELDRMREGHRHYVVARRDGRLVGYGGLLYSGDDAHVTNIAVDPARHRSGVGSRLLLHLAHHARDAGFINLTLEVRVSNLAAQELYRRFGFAPVGVRKKYYEDVEDAIVMWCHEIGDPAYGERLDRLEADLDR